MEDVLYEDHGEAFQHEIQGQAFNFVETQGQDGRDQDGVDHFYDDEEEEADEHGNSWHQDIHCEEE